MAGSADETGALLAAESPEERKRVLADLFVGHRDKLHTMVRLRLDPRLKARIGASDVLQEAYLEAQDRVEEYLKTLPMPFYLWLRKITAQKLVQFCRHHLGMQKRAAGREVPIDVAGGLHPTSEAMALALVAGGPSPSENAVRAELKDRLEALLDRMDPTDREIIALRHFEQLTVPETAQVLEIGEEAAKKRYLRAMKKLKDILADLPGLAGEIGA